MAEVLITLGIIGVVAALTMPALISHYQKQVWVTQLKKDVNYVQNSFRTILGNEGVESLKQTPLFVSENSFSNDKLKEYLQEEYIPETNQYRLRDGSCISFDYESYNKYMLIDLDVNCDKKPNVPGHDQFSFDTDSRGMLVNRYNDTYYCTANSSELESAILYDISACISNNWKPDMSREEQAKCENEVRQAYARNRKKSCFNKILKDGWQMKY